MFVAGEMYLSGSQLVFLFGCILLFASAAAHHNNEKHRLLLDDYDGTGRQLANLERIQQEITKLLDRFNTTVATLQAENKALQSKNEACEAKQQSHTVKQDKMIATLQCK
jgi:Skp family chaperone for outer membrane proteins